LSTLCSYGIEGGRALIEFSDHGMEGGRHSGNGKEDGKIIYLVIARKMVGHSIYVADGRVL
jgi:hypothetical protein